MRPLHTTSPDYDFSYIGEQCIFCNLIKNTSCLYIIGGADLISLTYSFVTGENTGGAYAPAYLVSGLLFFIICYPLSKTASVWEIHLKKRDQRVLFQRTEGTVTDNE